MRLCYATLPCLAVAAANPKVFDYVIVGGGTAGLVVANRLSEKPNVRVAVIEPGGDERNNPNVTLVTSYLNMSAFDTPIDWAYETVPQVGINGEPQIYHQGKAIGGTSAINGTYLCLLHPSTFTVPLELKWQSKVCFYQPWRIYVATRRTLTPGKSWATRAGTGRIYIPTPWLPRTLASPARACRHRA